MDFFIYDWAGDGIVAAKPASPPPIAQPQVDFNSREMVHGGVPRQDREAECWKIANTFACQATGLGAATNDMELADTSTTGGMT